MSRSGWLITFTYDKLYLSCKEDVHLIRKLWEAICIKGILNSCFKVLLVRCDAEAVSSKTGHFPTETQLSHAFVVRLWLAVPGSVIVIRASSLWDADWFVAGIWAVHWGLFARLGLVWLSVDVMNRGVEVAGGRVRDNTFDLCDAAVVMLFVVLAKSLVAVRLINSRVQRWLKQGKRKRNIKDMTIWDLIYGSRTWDKTRLRFKKCFLDKLLFFFPRSFLQSNFQKS